MGCLVLGLPDPADFLRVEALDRGESVLRVEAVARLLELDADRGEAHVHVCLGEACLAAVAGLDPLVEVQGDRAQEGVALEL